MNPGDSSAPASSSNPASDAEMQAATYDLSDSTILLVDDNEQNLELLLAYLEELPCKILTAKDGFEALAIVQAQRPNIVLLDVMMPRMSGFQVCSKLKRDPASRETPVVMVTALNEIGDVERAVDAGADDFLTKPVNKLELLTRVKSLVRLSLLQRQLHKTLAELKAMGGG